MKDDKLTERDLSVLRALNDPGTFVTNIVMPVREKLERRKLIAPTGRVIPYRITAAGKRVLTMSDYR